MYTKVEEAIHFMVKANKGQKRRNENIDKSFHPMVIFSMLREFTDIEEVLIAALLHDVINDTEYGFEEIEELFGTNVANMVSDLSEDMGIAKWFDRKKEYITRMKNNLNTDVINIMLADKLHNLISNYDSFLKYGDKLWKNTGGSKDENRYMYRELYNIARKKGANEGLLKRYRQIVTLYFGELEDE